MWARSARPDIPAAAASSLFARELDPRLPWSPRSSITIGPGSRPLADLPHINEGVWLAKSLEHRAIPNRPLTGQRPSTASTRIGSADAEALPDMSIHVVPAAWPKEPACTHHRLHHLARTRQHRDQDIRGRGLRLLVGSPATSPQSGVPVQPPACRGSARRKYVALVHDTGSRDRAIPDRSGGDRNRQSAKKLQVNSRHSGFHRIRTVHLALI